MPQFHHNEAGKLIVTGHRQALRKPQYATEAENEGFRVECAAKLPPVDRSLLAPAGWAFLPEHERDPLFCYYDHTNCVGCEMHINDICMKSWDEEKQKPRQPRTCLLEGSTKKVLVPWNEASLRYMRFLPTGE